MTRKGKDAGDWGLAHAMHDLDGDSWYRRCKEFVRLCFAVPSDGTPTAGAAWDRSPLKHMTSNPMSIPPWVPVFWEQPSLADHVALSFPGGRCLTTDFLRTGKADVVDINEVTRGWGGTLLGWTESIDSVHVYTPAPEPPQKNRVQRARLDVNKAIVQLERALAAGRGENVEKFRRELRQALRHNVKI